MRASVRRGTYVAGLLAVVLMVSGCGPSSPAQPTSDTSTAGEEPAREELSARESDMAMAAESVAEDHDIDVEQALDQLRAQDEVHDVDTSWDPGFLEIRSVYGSEYGVRWVTMTDGIEDRVREAVDASVGIDFALDYAVVTLDIHDLQEAARRVRDAVPEANDFSSSLDIASGAIVFYTPARPNDDLVEAVEAAAVPAVVRWEEGESVAY